jgi:hypothetical protein
VFIRGDMFVRGEAVSSLNADHAKQTGKCRLLGCPMDCLIDILITGVSIKERRISRHLLDIGICLLAAIPWHLRLFLSL